MLERDFPKTFEEYVKEGKDLFGLEDHFHNWRTAEINPPNKKVCMLRYERMFEEEVCRPLFEMICTGKDKGLISLMVEEFCRGKRARESVVPVELRYMMYIELCEEIRGMPPLLVRDAQGNEIQHFGTFAAYD